VRPENANQAHHRSEQRWRHPLLSSPPSSLLLRCAPERLASVQLFLGGKAKKKATGG
jgi:hypothetical protein